MATVKKPEITPTENGPYLVKDLSNLINQKGPVRTSETMALCRCGGSANKPFCDGTHKSNGFLSVKLAGRTEDKQDRYKGNKIMIHDNRGICAHAGRCTDGLAAVFHLREDPWIYPDSATVEEIVATNKKCPSGALSYTLNDPISDHTVDGSPLIFIAPHGPYVVSGSPELTGTKMERGASKEHFTLCRCGGSKNKPFCDGSHWTNGFKDDKN